jgi:DNA-binding LacI/PurR family transcriptional regulator
MPTVTHPEVGLTGIIARLEQDIRQRGLWAGDRYLTAAEAAEMLNVSPTTAHRAMQTLVKQRMLVRHRKRGTFVGPHFDAARSTSIRTVYLLALQRDLGGDGIALEPLVLGIRSRMTNANVQISFLPRGDTLPYVRELMQSALAAGKVAGFIPISCPRDVYRRLADSGIPTVMFGTPYSDQGDIPSVEIDNQTTGRLLAEHLTECGHRRIALFSNAEGRPGDNCFYDGVSEALTQRDLPHNALIIRIVPTEPAAVAGEMSRLLAMPDKPTAVIARSLRMARTASIALDRLDLPAAFEIVCEEQFASPQRDPPPFTYVRAQLSLDDVAATIGEMLERLGHEDILEEPHVLIPVELCRRGAL